MNYELFKNNLELKKAAAIALTTAYVERAFWASGAERSEAFRERKGSIESPRSIGGLEAD